MAAVPVAELRHRLPRHPALHLDHVVTRTLADVVRVAGAVSLVAVATRGGVALALMALVLLGLTLLRLSGVPPLLDLATGALLVAAAWWALLGSYERYPWLDSVVHLAA